MEPILIKWDDDIRLGSTKITIKISNAILKNYPLKEEEIESIFGEDDLKRDNAAEILAFSKALLSVWKYVVFFLPAPKKLAPLMENNSFPETVINGIIEVMTSKLFEDLIEKLSSCSYSNIPRVKNTEWTSQTVVSRNGNPTSEREVKLMFSTDQGSKHVQLTSTELDRLYWAVNDVQSSLDKLLQQ